jgi:hypothetical protein
MPITDKSRKILWARSGNRCAICRVPLVVEHTAQDPESVVGDECHIVSASRSGPRHDPEFPSDQFDALGNLILLCATHHKMVDDQQETYTAEVICSIKRNHEGWVENKLCDDTTPPPVRIRRIRQNIPSHLPRVSAGNALLAIAAGASAHSFNHDDDLSADEIELVGGFIQEVSEWVDLSSDLEPIEHVRTSMRIQELISDLESRGFWVFAAREAQQLEGGVGGPLTFPVLHLSVLRATNQGIHHAEPKPATELSANTPANCSEAAMPSADM